MTISQQNKDTVRLAHPIEWDNSYMWVRFPYIPPFSEHPKYDEHDEVQASTLIKDKVSHIDRLNTVDIRPSNIGILDNQVKIIDYGSIQNNDKG